jgi:glycosyltransferase involved in cell wall biosynthesis
MTATPFVSVIVPVYNDAARLRLCLEALEKQSYPAPCYEVIVVDNASTEDIKGVVAEYGHAVYALETTLGSYAARNRGLELAKGNFLAFTDADCIPKPDWLEKGVARLLAHPDCGVVGGEIELFFKDPRRPTSAELYETVSASFNFNQRRDVTKQIFSATANLFTFRRIFDEVGPFDATMKTGGDKEWCQRVVAAGYPLVYAPEVIIAHPARASLGELARRHQRLTGNVYRKIARKDDAPLAFARGLAKSLIALPPRSKLERLFSRADVELGTWDKIKVVLLLAFQRLLRTFELVRLRLGGEAKR